MSLVDDLKVLKAEAKKPPKLLPEDKRHPMVATGYAWGFQEALKLAIEMAEEAEDG